MGDAVIEAWLGTSDPHPVAPLDTNDGPCESLSRDVWFPLQSPQATAQVCVAVQGTGPGPLRVSTKTGSACILGTIP